jgi:plasmid stabilization system protein ParE
MKLIIAAAARGDLAEAVAWYDERSLIAGDRLLDDLNSTLQAIAADPSKWRSLRPGDSRRIIHLKAFPYSVIYRLTEKQIRILVIRHDSRREGYGLERK